MPIPCQSFTGNTQSLPTIHSTHLQLFNTHRKHAQPFSHPQDMSTACHSSIESTQILSFTHNVYPQPVTHSQEIPTDFQSFIGYTQIMTIILRTFPQPIRHT